MASRNRLSVNFSKKYTKEYNLIMQEENASELICKLLQKHYTGDVSNRDIMEKLDELSNKLKGVQIEEADEDLDEALDCWD